METGSPAKSKAQLAEHSPVVAFLGGTLDDERQIEFARAVGRAVVGRTRLRILVSGYKGSPGKDDATPFQPSFGYTVATAAAEALDEAGILARLITMPVKNRSDGPTVFELGQITRPRGRNDRSRRLSILSRTNVACLGGGGIGTQEIYDFARGLDLPVLPLPFLKGVCRQIWGRDHQALAGDFGLDADACQRWQTLALDKIKAASVEELAAEVADVLAAGVRKRCLVCMPFSQHFDWVLDHVIQPAATAACVDLIRLDLENEVGNISSHFRRELARADCVLAILTGERANVLYEIGFSHATGIEVLLLCQTDPQANAVEQIPFYLRNHRTIWYPDQADEPGIAAAQGELCQTLRKVGKDFKPSVES